MQRPVMAYLPIDRSIRSGRSIGCGAVRIGSARLALSLRQFLMRSRVMRATGRRRAMVVSLCAGLLFAGCSTPIPSVPPLRVLTLPGVRQVTAFTDLERRTGSRHLDGLTTYTSALPPHDQRILFTLGDELDDIGVETTDVIERPSCGVPYAVTSDGHWVVCRQFGNIALLDLATDSGHPHPSTQVLPYQDVDDPRSPTW